MKSIEDRFQELAVKIVAGLVPTISEKEQPIVNEFFALWYMRSRHRNLDTQEIQANGVTGANLTKDQEEHLEYNWTAFARQGGRMPARHLNGILLQLWTYRYANDDLAVNRWGIIHAQDGEFVVPDVPMHSIVPLTPTLCLVSPAPNGTIVRQNVADINRAVMEASQEYFFARDFSACPV